MVSGVCLITIARGRVEEVAERIAAVPGVDQVYSVGGRYDAVAVVRVPTNEELAEVVTRALATVEGIERTETLVAFRAFSRADLEAGFSLGA
jgi:DNA-binding Lrp family transcriptional regulator